VKALFVAALLAAAPPLNLPDANGARHRLADYRGKVVLVNFWATWCEPCLEELPAIERLRASLAHERFAVLAVQMGGSARTAADMAAKLRLHFPMLVDRDSTATQVWGVDFLPASFVIDARGEIVFRHPGEMDWSSAESRRRIESLLPRR
jgi:peroxiredoxin